MKKVFVILLVFCVLGSVAYATENRVFDYADLLTPEQESMLQQDIKSFQKDTAIDCVFLSSKEAIDSQSDYADSFYDQNQFGYGKYKSGVLYLIDMYNRIPILSTAGSAIDIMTDLRIQYAHDICYNDLREGNYFDAARKMLVVLQAYIYDGVPFGQFRYDRGGN